MKIYEDVLNFVEISQINWSHYLSTLTAPPTTTYPATAFSLF